MAGAFSARVVHLPPQPFQQQHTDPPGSGFLQFLVAGPDWPAEQGTAGQLLSAAELWQVPGSHSPPFHTHTHTSFSLSCGSASRPKRVRSELNSNSGFGGACKVGVFYAMPFLGFGVLDNGIMILAGYAARSAAMPLWRNMHYALRRCRRANRLAAVPIALLSSCGMPRRSLCRCRRGATLCCGWRVGVTTRRQC